MGFLNEILEGAGLCRLASDNVLFFPTSKSCSTAVYVVAKRPSPFPREMCPITTLMAGRQWV
jgi:hypothetical protein